MIYVKILNKTFYTLNTDLALKTDFLSIDLSILRIKFLKYTLTKEDDLYNLDDILPYKDLTFLPASLAYYSKIYFLKKYFKDDNYLSEKLTIRTDDSNFNLKRSVIVSDNYIINTLPYYLVDFKNKTWDKLSWDKLSYNNYK